MRVGIGYDIHRLKKGRKLFLGGVKISHPKGLEGHSDGDVLIHAVVDALLGAAGLGDIGEHFSDKTKKFKNADSRLFLRAAREMLREKKLKIVNVDTVLIAEEPKLSIYKVKISAAIARELGISKSQVNVKAKTNEGFGAIGRKDAIACQAIVSLSSVGV